MKSLFLLLGGFFVSSAVLASGITVGNGGNSCALDFAQRGRVIYNVIADNDFYKSKLNLKKLDQAINNTAIIVVEGKLYDKNGSLVPAKNDGAGKIYLSQEGWCNKGNDISNQFAIVLHEYLGVSHPGEDLQYQMSGPLYTQTSLTDFDFGTYLSTGSDFKTKTIAFTHVLQNTAQSIVIETKAIKEYFNVISIDESYRYGFRAIITCESGYERVELISIYADYNAKASPRWFYTERPLKAYRFNSHSICTTLVNKAELLSKEGLKIVFGLNSLKIIDFY